MKGLLSSICVAKWVNKIQEQTMKTDRPFNFKTSLVILGAQNEANSSAMETLS